MATGSNCDQQRFDQFRPALMLLTRTQLGTRFRRVLDDSDIVQQALLEAHRNAGSCKAKTAVERFAWLRRVLTNTIIDAVRLHTRAKRSVDQEVDWDTTIQGSALRAEMWLADRHSSPFERAERKEQLEQLAIALQKLPELQRESIELFHLQGCSLKEVSELLGRSGASVAGLIHRGLKQLRLEMGSSDPLSKIQIFAGKNETDFPL
ncbi:MAG TPA: sigma-70 family RNA polymerase sigma factor [Planctomycetaceae bacterium]|nr:sigma-70 family RNA polymerase sigma factor [Planctomycetaceae bacterium]